MPEVPHSRKRHHHPLLICRVNHFLITHRSTRLHHRSSTSTDHDIQSIAKRKESIGGYGRASEREIGVLCLDLGNAR
jgi:hypothetical protein